jgi:hypothetical protein
MKIEFDIKGIECTWLDASVRALVADTVKSARRLR